MKMERADGKDFEKSEDMQKWQNNGLRAMVIVPCFLRSQSIQPAKTGIIVFIRKKGRFQLWVKKRRKCWEKRLRT